MNEKDILRALGGVNPEFIADAAPKEKLRQRNPMLFRLIAALVAVAILMGALFAAIVVPKIVNEMLVPTPSPYGRYVLSLAKYPEMMQMPIISNYADRSDYYSDYYEWQKSNAKQASFLEDGDVLLGYFGDTSNQLLSGENSENIIYSPLNIYMTLAILAEITDGESRKQILDVIGISTIDELRRQANSLWNSIYCDNGASKRIIANSLWLDDDVQINRDTVERIASGYYASSYQGDFDDSEYLEEYCDWMNENTGNLFDFSPEKIGFDSLTAITLTSTLYLETLWADDEGFTRNSTSLEKFHTNSGDVSAYFMHSTRNEKLHAGEDFYAISLSLAIGGEMWFVLPYEDATVDEILSERHFIEYTMGIKPENSREYSITMSIPKFDVSTEKSISEDIKKLGITEVFKNTADFSPLSQTILTLNDIQHGSRLKIDENGVVGGAYVQAPITYGEPSFPLGTKFDFVLDRPFIFVVTSSAGIPIFVGVVNDPTKN